MTTAAGFADMCKDHTHHVAGCRPCQTRSAVRGRIRNRLIAYGQWRGLVDSAAVVEHCQELVAAGMSNRQIAAACGAGRSSVDRLTSDNPPELIMVATEERLMAVKPPTDGPRDRDYVNGLGAARRLQALTAIGYTPEDLAPLLGAGPQAVRRWRRQFWDQITFATHRRIAALYARLEGTPGSSADARTYAVEHGYLSPLAWDDDDIDDPNAQPATGPDPDPNDVDEVKVQRALHGFKADLTDAETAATLRAAMTRGTTFTRMCRDMGLNRTRAQRLLGAYPDLGDQQAAA